MKQYLPFILLISFFSLTNCVDILECIINIRPELSSKKLEVAHNNQYYFDSITAEVKNEPYDDGYDYYFTVSGEIPEGIEVFYEYRKVIFKGVPQESGRFNISVYLYVEAINECYYDDVEGRERCHDPLCDNNASRMYTLKVR